jgi:hypothetical protein
LIALGYANETKHLTIAGLRDTISEICVIGREREEANCRERSAA